MSHPGTSRVETGRSIRRLPQSNEGLNQGASDRDAGRDLKCGKLEKKECT